jgi:hypothetical protein
MTREACTFDLRQFTSWCRTRSIPLFSVRRADIETFARELEARGRARATITGRLCTIAGFYKVEEALTNVEASAWDILCSSRRQVSCGTWSSSSTAEGVGHRSGQTVAEGQDEAERYPPRLQGGPQLDRQVGGYG